MKAVIPKREAVTGDWRNSRQESFHFVFVHRMLSRMTKSGRELVWNIARMGEVGNTHRMLWSVKRIFSYNLDKRRSSKVTCTASLLEMAPLEPYIPSGSSPCTRSTRSSSILHWVSKMYETHVTQLWSLCMSVRYICWRELLLGCVVLNSDENFMIHQFHTGRQFTN
jgi:hypothetical protein